jgi:hypothetical protein
MSARTQLLLAFGVMIPAAFLMGVMAEKGIVISCVFLSVIMIASGFLADDAVNRIEKGKDS